MSSRRHLPHHLGLMVIVLLAVGYGFFQAAFYVKIDPGISAQGLALIFASNSRFHVFVILPVWLAAASLTIANSTAPEKLIRRGSWRASNWPPLAELLRRFGAVAVIVLITWMILIAGAVGFASAREFGTAIAMLLIEVIILVLALSAIYYTLATVHTFTGSRGLLALVAASIFVWAALSNIAVVPPNSLFNLALYFSLSGVTTQPGAALLLVLAAATASAAAWLSANSKDEAATGGRQGAFRSRGIAGAIGVGIVALGATSLSGDGDVFLGSFSRVFYGAGGSLIDYLVGMTSLLIYVAAATSVLAEELEFRDAALSLRYGSRRRWITRVLAREAGSLLVFVLIACFSVALISILKVGPPADLGASAVELTTAAGKLYLAGLSFLFVGCLSVVAFRSAIAGPIAFASLLALGMLPLSQKPWYPITGWSMSLSGDDALQGVLSLALFASVTVATIVTVAIHQDRRGTTKWSVR